jgi:acetyl-CoA carboxylase carboxyl transferase subunit alpha
MVSRELEFERPLLDLERQIEALRRIAAGTENLASVVAPDSDGTGDLAGSDDLAVSSSQSLEGQIALLEEKARELGQEVYSGLSRWQIVQLSRHPDRPYIRDYLDRTFTDFVELHGDRAFADDGAILGGLARFAGVSVMVIGHVKGRTTKENVVCNFGMARPEGYRKAIRLMRLAERFQLPIVTLIDTPGAYPGIDAEERGQAQAIAESIDCMASLTVPVVAVVIGEGGSGGALAIGVANRVLMLEYSTYSVISPEACSSILFRDASHAQRAADALRLTATDLLGFEVVDRVVEEPFGGAHRDPLDMADRLKRAIKQELAELKGLDGEALRLDRYERFRRLGRFEESGHADRRNGHSTATNRPGSQGQS